MSWIEEHASYTKDNTHIEDSYEVVNKQIMKEYLKWVIEERELRNYPITRSIESYQREWVGHNRLYNLHLFRSHTKDVDLCENISLWEEIIWLIIGGI